MNKAKRVNITINEVIEETGKKRAAELGMSFSEYIRHLIREDNKERLR